MQIHEVINYVGMSRKAITLYEQKGLIQVKKSENGYRDYDEETVNRLWQIKVLRKLDFSISDIEEVLKGNQDQIFQAHFDELDRRIAQCHTQKDYLKELYDHASPHKELYQQLDQQMETEFTMQEKIRVDIDKAGTKWSLEGVLIMIFTSACCVASPYHFISLIAVITLFYGLYKLCMLRGPVSLLDMALWSARERIVSIYKNKKKR